MVYTHQKPWTKEIWLQMKEIEIYKNVFDYQDNLKLYNKILKRNFVYGEVDNEDHFPTGMISELKTDEPLFEELEREVYKIDKNYKSLERAYINLFLPNENPYFHVDGNVRTFLFYLNPKVDLDEQGETQFYLDGEIRGIPPRPGLMVSFDGNVLHRATSFRTKPRITVALKYKYDISPLELINLI